QDISLHTDGIKYQIKGNKLTIQVYILKHGAVCELASSATNQTEEVQQIAQTPVAIQDDQHIEFHVFDFIEAEDFIELRDYISDMESTLATLQYSALSHGDVTYLAETINKISIILSSYNETFNVAITLRSLAFDIKDNVESFIAKSKALSSIFINFSLDLKDWQNSLFVSGAPSINFMDDTLMANASSIANLIKPIANNSSEDDDLDDIFSF
ncbi:MAG: hypothetical protein RL154_1537, partial [Pseudomonadota bacterium]